MKILLINHYAIPPTEAGGTRHYSLAKELIALGHEVHIIAANFSHQTKTPIIPNIKEQVFKQVIEGVPFIFVTVPSYTGNSPARLKNMLSFARQLYFSSYIKQIDKPDIVIGSSPHPFATWAAQKMAKRWGVPFIFEVRDLWPQSLIDLGRISPKNPAVRFMAKLEKYLYNQADKIITLLPGAHEYIQSVGIDPTKVVWIPNGIDFSLYNQASKSVDTDKFTVMYAGAHGLANGLETVIKCAELIEKEYEDKILFRLVGDGPEKAKLQSMGKEKQLTNVKFDNPVPKQDIPNVLNQADAFIAVIRDSPLYKYGISLNKIYDYLASMRPVVIGVNAFNNPVEEAQAGISVSSENPQELADAVLRIYNMSKSEREQMGVNGRKYVEENHDFRMLAEKLEGVLFTSISEHKC